MISTGTGILGYNMYAYCNNNPVMYVDSSGLIPFADHWYTYVIYDLCEAIFRFLYGHTEVSDPKIPDQQPEFSISKDDRGVENIQINVDVDNLSNDPEFLSEYTDILVDYIIEKYDGDFLKGEIDRAQFYAELEFHVIMWDRGVLTDRANPATINIYADGSVVDGRWYVDIPAFLFYRGRYE